MRKSIPILAGMFLLSILCVASFGATVICTPDGKIGQRNLMAEAKKKAKTITNSFFETDIRQALLDVAEAAGVSIVCGPQVTGFVSCDLKEAPLDKALQLMLAGTGYIIKENPDFILICTAEPSSPMFTEIAETHLIRMDYMKAEDACNLLSPKLKDYVKPEKNGNVVCVTAPGPILTRIENDMALIDRPPRHVMLDARIVVLERDDLTNMGVQWGWPRVKIGAFSNQSLFPSFDWGLQIGQSPDATFTDGLLLALNLLTQNEEATILSCPQVMGEEGREAEVKVITEEYFQILTGGYYTGSDLQKVTAGTILKIVPFVSNDHDITLDLSVEVSDVVARGDNDLPVVTRRATHSTVRVADGGTAVVAGLMDNRNRTIKDKVPGLHETPGIGGLFRNTKSLDSHRQIAVFITARVLNGGEAVVGTGRPVRRHIKPVNREEFQKMLKESLVRIDS